MKDNMTINNSFPVFTNADPICSPIGMRDMSTPKLNKVIPAITAAALTRKRITFHDGIGAMV
jgi:hypothetical protein